MGLQSLQRHLHLVAVVLEVVVAVLARPLLHILLRQRQQLLLLPSVQWHLLEQGVQHLQHHLVAQGVVAVLMAAIAAFAFAISKTRSPRSAKTGNKTARRAVEAAFDSNF